MQHHLDVVNEHVMIGRSCEAPEYILCLCMSGKLDVSTEAWAKSSCHQENSAIILVVGEFRPIYLDGSLNFRASPHQISPKI